MELHIFMKELESALVQRGIAHETAQKHVSNLRRTFTNDDLSEIEAISSTTEIEELADSISVILNKNKPTAPRPAQTARPTAAPPVPVRQPERVPVPQPPRTPAAPKKIEKIEKTHYSDEDDYRAYAEPLPTTKGMLIFWIGLFLTLPLTLGLLAAFFGVFIVLFVGLAALIVGCVAALIALVAVGAGVSLIGIIFGITQLFSFPAAGLYEIGLGVMVAGAVLFVSILLYNIAIRLLPWIITQVGNLLGFLCRKLKSLFFVIRRECYKL